MITKKTKKKMIHKLHKEGKKYKCANLRRMNTHIAVKDKRVNLQKRNMCNTCKQSKKIIKYAAAPTGNKRRWVQYVHLRRLLRKSKVKLKQCRQNARYLILLHKSKHAISGFIALFQKIGAKSVNLRTSTKNWGKKRECSHLS